MLRRRSAASQKYSICLVCRPDCTSVMMVGMIPSSRMSFPLAPYSFMSHVARSLL